MNNSNIQGLFDFCMKILMKIAHSGNTSQERADMNELCVCVFARLTLRAHYLHVEVGEATGRGQRQFNHAFHSDSVAVQVVEQGAVFVVVRHQPQLSPRPVICRKTTGRKNRAGFQYRLRRSKKLSSHP